MLGQRWLNFALSAWIALLGIGIVAGVLNHESVQAIIQAILGPVTIALGVAFCAIGVWQYRTTRDITPTLLGIALMLLGLFLLITELMRVPSQFIALQSAICLSVHYLPTQPQQ